MLDGECDTLFVLRNRAIRIPTRWLIIAMDDRHEVVFPALLAACLVEFVASFWRCLRCLRRLPDTATAARIPKRRKPLPGFP